MVLDGQAMARRGTKIGELENFFLALLTLLVHQVEMLPGAAKVLPRGSAGA